MPKFNRLVFILNPYNPSGQQSNNNNSKATANKYKPIHFFSASNLIVNIPFKPKKNKRDRLSSIDLLQVKKLKEHVYQKILKLDEQSLNNDSNSMSANTVTTAQGGGSGSVSSSSGGMAANSDSQNQQKQSTTSLNGVNNGDLSSIANRTIELICSDTVYTFIVFFLILFKS